MHKKNVTTYRYQQKIIKLYTECISDYPVSDINMN